MVALPTFTLLPLWSDGRFLFWTSRFTVKQGKPNVEGIVGIAIFVCQQFQTFTFAKVRLLDRPFQREPSRTCREEHCLHSRMQAGLLRLGTREVEGGSAQFGEFCKKSLARRRINNLRMKRVKLRHLELYFQHFWKNMKHVGCVRTVRSFVQFVLLVLIGGGMDQRDICASAKMLGPRLTHKRHKLFTTQRLTYRTAEGIAEPQFLIQRGPRGPHILIAGLGCHWRWEACRLHRNASGQGFVAV